MFTVVGKGGVAGNGQKLWISPTAAADCDVTHPQFRDVFVPGSEMGSLTVMAKVSVAKTVDIRDSRSGPRLQPSPSIRPGTHEL